MNTLRSCIISEEGYTFLSLDASQIELRVVAILSQDPLLLEALQSEDLHLATAIQVFGHTEDTELMAKRRYDAKQLNFAVLYGASADKIAEMADCTEAEAKELIRKYFSTYVVLKQWIDSTKAQARKDGYVTNMFGRIRPIPKLNAGSWSLREKGEREAINTIVQGTAVDIVKLAMIYLKRLFSQAARLVLQVHDEILFEVPDELLADCLEKSKELKLAFPDYPFSMSVGKVYGEMKKEDS